MSEQTSIPTERRYDLDWLRVLLILAVFVFHTGRFFDPLDWHVKNPVTYAWMDLLSGFIASWVMPVIFLVSGAAVFFALRPGRGGKFIRDKVLRLLVPLGVGVFTHVALQVYLERRSHRLFYGSFFEFYPQYFHGAYGEGGNFAWMGLHLWYLLALFLFCLLGLPLFMLLKGRGQAALRWFGDLCARPGVVYLLALPVIALAVLIDPQSKLGNRAWGGWSIVAYIPFFLYGFLIISSRPLQDRIVGGRWISLALGTGSALGLLVASRNFAYAAYGSANYTLGLGFFALNAWAWTLVILGFGLDRLNFANRFLAYAGEAVLPFYVLHQTVLLIVGYYVVRWAIPDLLKYFVIGLSSFAIVMLLYEFAIRRVNVLRVLFGMKARPASTVAVATPKVRRARA